MSELYIPSGAGESEYVEKRSRFLGHVRLVESEEEARAAIADFKKQYYDARHNCWCYRLGENTARYSDDGEPQGTAGLPVLNVLKQSGATDLCVVVTRYFGGILLGAGGLVRAYGASAKLALDTAGLAVYEPYAVLRIETNYSDYQKLTAALPKIGASEDGCDFGALVTVTAAIEESREEELSRLVAELTYGKGKITRIGTEERASVR